MSEKFKFIPGIDATPEEIEKQKKIINGEGWDGNAAIQIGDEKEQQRLDYERKEGKYANLESFIRDNNTIIAEELNLKDRDFTNKLIEPATAILMMGNFLTYSDEKEGPIDRSGHSLIYLDKNNNLKLVHIPEDKIASLNAKDRFYRQEEIEKELKQLGFNMVKHDGAVIPMIEEVEKFVRAKMQKEKKEKADAFDF